MDLRTVAQVPALRTIFFAHLLLVVWTTQYHWLPNSYTLYNSLFLISLLWSLHAHDSEDAIFVASGINILSIVFDAITIGMYYDVGGSTSFSNFMIIVNLLLRPITSLVLLRFYNERVGHQSAINFLPGFGATGFTDRGSYEDLERGRMAPQQSVPAHHSSSDPQVDVIVK